MSIPFTSLTIFHSSAVFFPPFSPHKLILPSSYHPYQREDRKQQTDDEAGDQFDSPVSPPPAREAVVPQRGQQLLAVRLSHKLKGEGVEIKCASKERRC